MEQEGRFDFEKFQPHHFSGGLVTQIPLMIWDSGIPLDISTRISPQIPLRKPKKSYTRCYPMYTPTASTVLARDARYTGITVFLRRCNIVVYFLIPRTTSFSSCIMRNNSTVPILLHCHNGRLWSFELYIVLKMASIDTWMIIAVSRTIRNCAIIVNYS